MGQSILQLPAGQTTAANSVPVTLPSDQGTLVVQDTAAEASLSTLATNLPAKGQVTMANSLPVAIASDQTAVRIKGAVAEGAAISDPVVGGIRDASGNALAFRETNADSSSSGVLRTHSMGYNGTNMDRVRMNTTGAIVAAGATTTQSNVALTTYNAKKLIVIVNVTAGAGSVTVTINASTSSSYTYPLLVSSALSGVATTPLRIFPGATPSANAVANDAVPRNVTVTATVSGSITYGIDYVLGV